MLLTNEEFTAEYETDNSTHFPAEQITRALASAKSKLIELVGSASVAEVEAAGIYDVKGEAIRDAHGLLTFRRLLLTVNKFRNGGMVTTEKDENDTVTNSFESYEKLQQRRKDLLAEAIDLVSVYLIAEEVSSTMQVDHSGFVPIEVVW